jgi:hypothetical protein
LKGGDLFLKIKIIKHEKENLGLLHHKALIHVTEWDGNETDLVENVSIEVGYHPAGYGLYGGHSVTPTGNENEYIVSFRTGTHCD